MDRSKSALTDRTRTTALTAAEWIGERSRSLLARRGVDDYCDVDVEQRDGCMVFWGQVDSAWTRDRILALAFARGGVHHVVDNLKILSPEIVYQRPDVPALESLC